MINIFVAAALMLLMLIFYFSGSAQHNINDSCGSVALTVNTVMRKSISLACFQYRKYHITNNNNNYYYCCVMPQL